jgi:hypothetical protein
MSRNQSSDSEKYATDVVDAVIKTSRGRKPAYDPGGSFRCHGAIWLMFHRNDMKIAWSVDWEPIFDIGMFPLLLLSGDLV